MQKITIQGMHCGACEKLIKMEIEEAGFSDAINSFTKPVNNQGQLILKEGVSKEEIEKIKNTINQMADYSVTE